MADRPILFNGAMVRAILSGRKTQTRRALIDQNPVDLGAARYGEHLRRKPMFDKVAQRSVGTSLVDVRCPFGRPGDRLWVRESFADLNGTGIEHRLACGGPLQRFAYAADTLPGSASDEARKDFGVKWTPSIHMPRAACRLVLEVTDVRVERLQAISESDVFSEGLERLEKHDADMRPTGQYRALNQWLGKGEPDIWDRPAEAYRCLWESTGGDWAANPWVWVVSFRIAEGQAHG